jgi:hypothetical protein
VKAPGEVLRTVRRVVLFVALALVLYGVARFDLVLLPEGARSPLYGLHAGDRLLVDRHARRGAADETWLYRGAEGELLIGRATSPPAELEPAARAALAAGGLWLVAERPVPGVADSRTLGPIPGEARVGRVLFVLPW